MGEICSCYPVPCGNADAVSERAKSDAPPLSTLEDAMEMAGVILVIRTLQDDRAEPHPGLRLRIGTVKCGSDV
jgi:hypothetical protein